MTSEVCTGVWWASGLPVSVGLPPAAASEARPSAPSLSDRLPQPGAVPPPAQPPAAVASGPTGRPDCGSSAALAHDPLTKPNSHCSTVLSVEEQTSIPKSLALCFYLGSLNHFHFYSIWHFAFTKSAKHMCVQVKCKIKHACQTNNRL